MISEKIFRKFRKKFEEFSGLENLDNECKAKVQELLAIQTEYFIECANEMVNDMMKEFEKAIDKHIKYEDGILLKKELGIENNIYKEDK